VRLTRREFNFGLAASAVSFATGLTAARADVLAESSDPLAMVNPELRDGARRILAFGQRDWAKADLAALRKAAPPPPAPLAPPAPAVESRTVPGLNGQPDVGIQLIGRNESERLRPAVLHIHGGGFIVGRVDDMTAFCQKLSMQLDCAVVNVDYRLSPDTPFPGPVEDNYAALRWLHDNAGELGVDSKRIAIMGESAGGGLAAMLAIAARDRGEVPVCYQVLIYPMLDDRTGSTRRVPPHIGTIGWDESGNRFGWTSFLGLPAGSPRVPEGAVPARVEDLAGLPPAFIGVGSIDLFVDEDLEYSRRLIDAGVPTTLNVVPGAYHGFDFIAPDARVSREFVSAWAGALGDAFKS
jgi:acetyl esterase/lipase